MANKNRKRSVLIVLALTVVLLSGCQDIANMFKGFEESFKGLEMTIQTYDEESNVIDKITGKSVSIVRDTEFDTDYESQDSSVMKITIGSNEMHHVGSSMIIAEKGLENVFEEYTKTVDIENLDRGVPFINTMVNDVKASFTGKEKVILIRSQNGTPLATYSGDKVSLYRTGVPKSTGILIDGQYLFIYRADYTIYDIDMIQ